ncbi:MAG: NAD-dependent epimerase/dehydratase family protein [bacterium]
MMRKKHESKTLKGKKILITGGGGFIGSSLAVRLAGSNEVILYDTDFKGNSIAYTGLERRPNVKLVKGSVTDGETLRCAADGVTHVVHAAAVVGVQRVLKDSLRTIETNFIGSSFVLNAATQTPGLERFLYFSTSEVFGVNAYRVNEEASSVFGSVKDPRWSYSISKIAGEHLVQSYHREHGIPTVIVRPFNIFGPRRLGEHAVKTFILQALRGRPLTVHNTGSQIRSWCYIDDMVDALEAALVRDAAVGEVFNVGNPMNTVSVYHLAKLIVALCKSRSPIRMETIEFTDVELRVPDVSKARELLGFSPRVELNEGLAAAKRWYAANPS